MYLFQLYHLLLFAPIVQLLPVQVHDTIIVSRGNHYKSRSCKLKSVFIGMRGFESYF